MYENALSILEVIVLKEKTYNLQLEHLVFVMNLILPLKQFVFNLDFCVKYNIIPETSECSIYWKSLVISLHKSFSALKTQAVCFSKTFLSTCEFTQCNSPENHR
jgi:hypothetical protein